MAYEILTVPFNPVTKSFHTDNLNRFCMNKHIVSTKSEFFRDGNDAYWTVFVEYEAILETEGKAPEKLTETGRLCYEKLREWRKLTAEKDGVPPFVIAKNADLVEVIRKEAKTLEALKQINGFGRKKVEKYGKDLVGIVKTFFES
jgi:superfamily II DNA helicase RecQ|tara:strand:- start:526 stop:960 length:435 start_codon:yes stop_codon:yes gene_type:complete